MGSCKRILVVDDSGDTLAFMSRLLIRKGYSVSLAATCREALNEIKKSDFDLLISDIVVVDGDGCELLRNILAFRAIKAIAISSVATPEDRKRIEQAGFQKYLVKPVDVPQLLNAITDVLASSERIHYPW